MYGTIESGIDSSHPAMHTRAPDSMVNSLLKHCVIVSQRLPGVTGESRCGEKPASPRTSSLLPLIFRQGIDQCSPRLEFFCQRQRCMRGTRRGQAREAQTAGAESGQNPAPEAVPSFDAIEKYMPHPLMHGEKKRENRLGLLTRCRYLNRGCLCARNRPSRPTRQSRLASIGGCAERNSPQVKTRADRP